MKLKRSSRWAISYIDLLMTLLGFFVLLYAREHDPHAVAASLRSAFTHNSDKNSNKSSTAQSPKDSEAVSKAETAEKAANKDCGTTTGIACPTHDFVADALFQPEEAVLTDQGKAVLTDFFKKSDLLSAHFLIESQGIGNGNARFDKWELAAARTATVARQLKAAGVADDRLKIMMAPDNPSSDKGQHLMITANKN
ncbi:MAG: flagellar motor protein MotB [Zymomonas mobilis subsp. pomaceae]|uniref:Motility protein B-like N-terminal domain-containing protein n=1 Tax=Zymomonas mobilis subsp. pomaceae (strain ATCC 29192 / DSM 22645 / JCM 10191 / CCUG 17912 / NBRC 13757 / NCIMB 11200 / NRRL B-4491 / Barker I) TaxID=579138 RepID=F8ERP9_ZYMMT|nr:flagellar motor protein MotB [Zymomonas mobilis]AEI37507.1 hypothetical protein Zymop_0605 [Zymomonas mobilis subsp. pomaceae ATCC 29192]MDX5948875.1 flagellar motor protein MotB [Zymomonas mobilis subsp. pomaceae]GEB88682.1 hypothetical protein ZMO02_03190 [Zymomonas mobilis subsp. pomaceae]